MVFEGSRLRDTPSRGLLVGHTDTTSSRAPRADDPPLFDANVPRDGACARPSTTRATDSTRPDAFSRILARPRARRRRRHARETAGRMTTPSSLGFSPIARASCDARDRARDDATLDARGIRGGWISLPSMDRRARGSIGIVARRRRGWHRCRVSNSWVAQSPRVNAAANRMESKKTRSRTERD